MKKTINIHLCQQIFTLDEDACKLLEEYLSSTRTYFSRMDDGEEISNDIETRVSELLGEYKAQGYACITMKQVEEIIARIGNPEEMIQNEEQQQERNNTDGEVPPIPERTVFVERKFFRDPETAMLGGVISGLCHYFGFKDVTLWRLIFVVLCFFSFSISVIAYALLYIIIPPAVTPEERLQMRGEPINFQSINEEVMKGVAQTEKMVNSPAMRSFWSKALKVCFIVLLFLLCVPIIITLGIQLILLLVAMVGLLFSLFGATSLLSGIPVMLSISSFFDIFPTSLNVLYFLCGLCFFILIVIPLYLVAKSIIKPSHKTPSTVRMRLWWTWFMALILGCLFAVIAFFSAVMGIESGAYDFDEDKFVQCMISIPEDEDVALPLLPMINMNSEGVEIEVKDPNNEVVKLIANDSVCIMEVGGQKLVNVEVGKSH